MHTRVSLLMSLRGQSVVIPNMYIIFADWVPVEVSPHYAALADVSAARLNSIFISHTNPKQLSALHASDFALFASTWWPHAPLPRLTILLYFAIWLFNWDDEIDEPSGIFADDACGAAAYRAQTLAFVSGCLGLSGAVGAENKIVRSFGDVGEEFGGMYGLAQKKRFVSEMEQFMEHSAREQEVRLCERISRVDEYWNFRMGTSAVGVVVATLEYAMGFLIADAVMCTDERIKVITDETTINVSIVNDLLSLKKEITKGCIDSLIPIYCALGMSAQSAVDKAVHALQESKCRFDIAVSSLLESALKEPVKYKHVSEWIEGCQRLCMGNLVWSLKTGRYGVTKHYVPGDGSVRFTL